MAVFHLYSSLQTLFIKVSMSALAVVILTDLSLEKHVINVNASATLMVLVHSFVTPGVDYCKVVFAGPRKRIYFETE